MNPTVDCPYCAHPNDMSDGTIDLPSDNRFDQECTKCEREFEVIVEFTPYYSSAEINYTSCQRCGRESRDMRERGRTFPYPDSLKEDKVCDNCWRIGYSQYLDKEAKLKGDLA